MKKYLVALLVIPMLFACQDEVGTQAWCDNLNDTPKSEWNAQNALDFAKHCVFSNAVGSENWCRELDDKPKGDWSANEVASYTKHCVF
ncbi:DUF3012 domain-containing protein [Vibrio sinaloensis]|uniref:DUF3012 domain-containing protein n=1 Tax=Photobacterium sp. (strain ATCC 43367) TaxID=379097 RepID=UPI0020625221|nr:DUF3012 domain-containing protein [Vibrio sinaloensis]UPQ89589.1 DUF3012 domain-containing protein [Vibrio sinaloensis]